MTRYVAVLVALFAVSALAQQSPRPKPTPQPSADPSEGAQRVNIRLDVSVIDQMDAKAGQPKTLMMILADQALGQARAAYEDRAVSVDARPTIVDDLIRVRVTVSSQEPTKMPTPESPFRQPDPLLNWTNSFTLLLPSGKPMVALETSDSVTKRKMSIEVKATILK